MAGLGSELFNLATSYDPAGAMRQADVGYQQYQLQSQALQQRQQERAQEAAQAKGLPVMAGTIGAAGGQPQALGQMAGNMLGPQYKLTTPDGELTSAGLVNQTLMTAQKEEQNAQAQAKEAKFLADMGQTKEAQVAGMEARRYMNNAQRAKEQAQKLKTEAKDDFASSLYGANSQGEYDQRLKDALERTGIEPPKDFPTVWSPEMKAKLLSKMSPTMRAKIEAQDRAKEAQKNANERADRLNRSIQALGQNGMGKEYKEVKGQVEGLKNYIPESEIKKLGPKEVVAVSTKLEAAELTDELATLVQQNPQAAGLVGSFYKNFDKFLPERYDSQDASAATEIINREADKLEKSGVPKDEVTQARLIAKKAVDVINARALAASGGGRVLVSELRLQKDVLGLEGLSPTSAVGVYRGLAESDRKSTKRYGVDTSKIKRTAPSEKITEKPAETKSATQAVTTREQFDALPSGTVYIGKDGKKYRKL